MDEERREQDEGAAAQADLLDYAAAAAMLTLPIGTLYAWVSLGRIPHYRIGPRLVRFSRRRLQAWLDERAVEPRDGARGR